MRLAALRDAPYAFGSTYEAELGAGENSWRSRLEARVRFVAQVDRCAITTQNPDSGEPDLDTLRAIKEYRGLRDGKRLDFGIYGEVVRPGRVRVGDLVEPLA